MTDQSAVAGANSEEAWYALLQHSRSLRETGDDEGFVRAALSAFRQRPHRAEPLHDLAHYYLGKSRGDIAVICADAGLWLPIPEADHLGVEPAVYETGLKQVFTIAASYSKDPKEKERGRAICNWLSLSRAVPDEVRGLARHNYHHWYVEAARSLWPSIQFYPISIDAPEGFKPGNISIVRKSDGFVALIRAVNYEVLESGFFDRHGDTSFRQRTLLAHLDENLEIASSAEVFPPEDLPPPEHTDSIGFEDPRPITWRGDLWCISSVRQLNPDGRAEMVLARIVESPSSPTVLTDWRVLASGMPVQWEKNWMPQVVGDDLRFIYSLDPTRILSEFRNVVHLETPALAIENLRGGSQAIAFHGGWLMVVHEWQVLHTRRHYFHRFVWLDKNNHLSCISRRFFFQSIASEFAAGLAWHVTGDSLVLSFGTDDHEPTLAVIEADDVRAALLDIDEHRKASELACEAGRMAWETLRTGQDPGSAIRSPELVADESRSLEELPEDLQPEPTGAGAAADHSQPSAHLTSMPEYLIDENGCLRGVPSLNPLIYTSAYGSEIYYRCLNFLLQSLATYGKYQGHIAILSDRERDETWEYVPANIRDKALHFPISGTTALQRYDLRGLKFSDYSPILYLDNDIVVDDDLSPILTSVALNPGICVVTEAETYPDLHYCRVSEVQDERRIGNWFGLDLFRADPSCCKEFLPVANSGVIGFSNHLAFRIVGDLVIKLYRHPRHESIAKWFGDQPFLNYALVKTKMGAYDVLEGRCKFLQKWDDSAGERRGIAHFVWARNEEKPRQMERYLEYLSNCPNPSKGHLISHRRHAGFPIRRPNGTFGRSTKRPEAIELIRQVTDMVVQTGLFAGLRMTTQQTWGGGEDIAPQLLGVYEQELHETIRKLLRRHYRRIVNIGCAEGFYAVGLARLLPEALVYAFDISTAAQSACSETAQLNGAGDRVFVQGACGPANLAAIAAEDPNLLVVVDCEGYEKELLTSEEVVKALSYSDVIIETHDFVDRSITPSIIGRYICSHRISILHASGRDPNVFPFLSRFDDLTRWSVICENRPEMQSWLVLESHARD